MGLLDGAPPYFCQAIDQFIASYFLQNYFCPVYPLWQRFPINLPTLLILVSLYTIS